MTAADDSDHSPTVSVLIAAFDVADVLPRAVASALTQCHGDVEVIVVDDASPSADTVRVARRLASQDSRVRVLERAKNGGPGAARADGLTAARGDWVTMLDADDRMLPGRLERLVAHALSHDLDLVADNLLLLDPVAGVVGKAFPVDADEVIHLSPERVLANSVPGGRINLAWIRPVVRRTFLLSNDITWPPLRHAEDLVFVLRTLVAHPRGHLLGTAGYEYTQRRGSLSGESSPASRTVRNVDHQLAAVEMIASHDELTREARRRLDRMSSEIGAVSSIMEARAHVDGGRYVDALQSVLDACRQPRALLRSTLARYGPRSRRLV